MELDVNVLEGEVAIVTMPKMINFKNAKSISEDLFEVLYKYQKIIVNFKDLILLDSSGVGTFIDLVKNAKQKNVKFVFCSLQNQVMQLIKLSKLISLFTIYENEAEAINALKSD